MDTKWIDFFTQLGLSTAGQILLLIVVGFFGKQLIQYFFSTTVELKKVEFSKDIEKYKQELISQTEQHRIELDKILETHRSSLNLLNAKNSRLHDKQLQIITELYKRIVVMERAFREMTSLFKKVYSDMEKEEQERVKCAEDSYNEYLIFYTENKIFFSEETSEFLDILRKQIWESNWDYTYKQRMGSDDRKTNWERFENAGKIISEKVPEVLKQLERNFRQLLTVE